MLPTNSLPKPGDNAGKKNSTKNLQDLLKNELSQIIRPAKSPASPLNSIGLPSSNQNLLLSWALGQNVCVLIKTSDAQRCKDNFKIYDLARKLKDSKDGNSKDGPQCEIETATTIDFKKEDEGLILNGVETRVLSGVDSVEGSVGRKCIRLTWEGNDPGIEVAAWPDWVQKVAVKQAEGGKKK